MLKSRNTMVASAVLFLAVVVLLRFTGGFFEDNVVRVVGSIFGGNAESIPLLDFSNFSFASLNPAEWSTAGITEGVNQWFHNMIDSVLPAMIYSFNATVIHMAVFSRIELMGAGIKIAKFSAVV